MPANTVTHRLVGWGSFEDLASSIKPRVFGHMVQLAIPVVKEYHSDLFHDATWLNENLTADLTFDYVVRTSGTNLGETTQYSAGSPGAVHYRLTLRADTSFPAPSANADWYLDITEIGRVA